MKTLFKRLTAKMLFITFLFTIFFFNGPLLALGANTPDLGAAENYGVLASTYSDSSAATTVNGSVGFTIAPASAIAGVHTYFGPGAPYATAGIDQGNALTALNAELCTFNFAPGAIDLSTDITHGPIGVYTPGVYCSTGAMNVGGPLTLSGSGTFIFRPVGAFTSTAGAIVTLAGSSVCDVFWTPTAATTLAANTTFNGTIIDDAGITVGANTNWTGRALAFGGTVTTDTNTITAPICTGSLKVIKVVNNGIGGVAVPADFNMHVKKSGLDIVGSPAVGVIAPGTSYTLLTPGTYIVSEDVNAAFTQTFSGDCDLVGNMTLTAGANLTCTVTNTFIDVPGTIHVIKQVINDNGGVATEASFNLHVKLLGVDVVGSPAVGTIAPGTAYSLVAGTYVISEDANASYTQTFSGDCDLLRSIILTAGADKTCTVINNDIAVGGGGGRGGGGGGGGGGSSIVFSKIGIQKVPTPISLPKGSGSVTYDYTVWKIEGGKALVDVSVTDDKCKPLTYVSGDTNKNSKLDTNEKWKYRCITTLYKTTINTAIAKGYSDDSYHRMATSTTKAKVTVGLVGVSSNSNTVPEIGNTPEGSPIIHLTKTPSPTMLFSKGGYVTYTYKVTNPGEIALENIQLGDDKCSPVNYVDGDTNGNSKLDNPETWTYTCQAYLTKETTNTAVVSGEANDIFVTDFAIAKVLFSINYPKLPNTRFYFEKSTSQILNNLNNSFKKIIKETLFKDTTKIEIPKEVGVGLPIRLKIPVLKIDAAIEYMDITSTGAMRTPAGPSSVGWFKYGPNPGDNGSAVIAGHYGRWKNGDRSVFDNLNKLNIGDKIYIENDRGITTTFLVRDSQKYDPKADATNIFESNDGNSHLNLITCDGAWNKYSQSFPKRLVVFADKE